jgi:hypothetical protein
LTERNPHLVSKKTLDWLLNIQYLKCEAFTGDDSGVGSLTT